MASENLLAITLRLLPLSLNPCSCGRWLQRNALKVLKSKIYDCLNPCSCGRWLQSSRGNLPKGSIFLVLILVLVEDGFRVSEVNDPDYDEGLNPCSCGRWLQSLER